MEEGAERGGNVNMSYFKPLLDQVGLTLREGGWQENTTTTANQRLRRST